MPGEDTEAHHMPEESQLNRIGVSARLGDLTSALAQRQMADKLTG
jgi:hypothetical protein